MSPYKFASGEMLEHPRDGLTLFGPVDSKGIEKPHTFAAESLEQRAAWARFESS